MDTDTSAAARARVDLGNDAIAQDEPDRKEH